MREWWAKVRLLARGRRGLEDELDEEVRAHLGFLVEENLERGLAPEEALLAARRRFGNEPLARERAREAWQFPRLETFLADLAYGLRGARRSPGFAALVLLTLALGIGANTAMFSVVYAVLVRPLPYPSSERLLWLGESGPQAQGISVTWLNYRHWRAENRTLEDVAAFMQADLTLTGRGEAVSTHAGVVTSRFFRLTGWRPVLGRLFVDADDQPGAAPTVVLGHEFWASTLGGDPGVVGETLALNGKPYQVLGVLRPGLRFFTRRVDLYLPLGPTQATIVRRDQHGSIRALGLLRPGVSVAEARADLDAILNRLAAADPGPEDDHRAFARPLAEQATGDVRQSLLVLAGAVALVLALACANVASLLLVRGTARARELAIRTAIGAGRARLVRQLLTESLVLAVLGGALGVLLAHLCLRALVRLGPAGIPRLSEAGLDPAVLAFAVAVTAGVGLLTGAAPGVAAGRTDLALALKDGAPGPGGTRRGHALRSGLVVAEIAITLVLAFAATLLLRSLAAAQTTDPGFRPDHLLALELQLPSSRYRTGESTRRFYEDLARALRAEPGVEAVGAAGCPPSGGACGDWWYSIAGEPAPARDAVPLTLINVADADYFRTVGIGLVAGRGFGDGDREGAPPVVLVNRELARRWWPTPRLAVGRQIKIGGPYQEGPLCEIVGVVGSVSQTGLDAAPLPELWFAFRQRPSEAMTVMVRTRAEPASLVPAVRRRVASVDEDVPVRSLRVFEEWLGATLARRRFSTLLLGAFAALAVVLAAVGTYGVLNYWVGAHQREIAIRVALGARRSGILGWAASHAVRLTALGTALGAVGSGAASRWLAGLVFGVSAHDPATLLAAAAGVTGIAALAAGVPLWRATRVDAVRTLHEA